MYAKECLYIQEWAGLLFKACPLSDCTQTARTKTHGKKDSRYPPDEVKQRPRSTGVLRIANASKCGRCSSRARPGSRAA